MSKENDFDPESYEMRINAFLDIMKRQNEQAKREEAWFESQNKKHKLPGNKKIIRNKSKAQVRKEQLQKQVPNLKNINKFFNFY